MLVALSAVNTGLQMSYAALEDPRREWLQPVHPVLNPAGNAHIVALIFPKSL
jgi:hypothetical protein